jgi:hypothetical protein
MTRRTRTKHPLWRKWTNIQDSLTRPANKQYATAQREGWQCDWQDFWSFADDVEQHLGLPQPGQILIRKDQHIGWTLNNLMWGNEKIRGNLQRTCVRLTLNNTTHTMKEWAELFNIDYGTFYSRIQNHGWTLPQALELEPRSHGPH